MTRDWPAPQRNAVLTADYLVASSSPAVSGVGERVLADGGTAIDATLAMAAMCWLALPSQCGVGGDAFAIVREPDGSVWTVGGSGFGPDGGDSAFYRERGLAAVPVSGALAVAAPGGVAALSALHARGASRPLGELWAPAIAAAGGGLPCSAKNRADILDHEAILREDAGAERAFLRDGRAPQIGERLPQPELAHWIRRLAADPRDLYTGELAQRAVAALVEAGAPFSGDEWAASGEALVGPAITGRYGGLTVHATPLPTPGWMVLQQAALCDDALGDLPWLGAEAVGLLAAAARLAFRDRWERCGSDTDAWQALLEPDAIAAARVALGRPTAAAGIRLDGDTTSTVAVDAEGRAVSFIHSLAFAFGAKVTVPDTGIVLNNRLGRGAYLVEGHPNEVRPRRRPLHTLNAWLATDDEGRSGARGQYARWRRADPVEYADALAPCRPRTRSAGGRLGAAVQRVPGQRRGRRRIRARADLRIAARPGGHRGTGRRGPGGRPVEGGWQCADRVGRPRPGLPGRRRRPASGRHRARRLTRCRRSVGYVPSGRLFRDWLATAV